MDSEDAACIARIAQRDQTALNDLYTRYRPRLYRHLFHQLHGDPSLVEEALQDTFLAVWRAAATFRGEASVATWLFRIAQRCAGRAARAIATPTSGMVLSLAEIGEDARDAALAGHEEHTLTRLALHEALRRLSEKQRDVLLLVFVQGFTQDEAAEILGIPVGTVKSRLHAARALLLHDPALQHIEEVNS
jgi:RNA polymerase sigma-70 factor, ECF subfamily